MKLFEAASLELSNILDLNASEDEALVRDEFARKFNIGKNEQSPQIESTTLKEILINKNMLQEMARGEKYYLATDVLPIGHLILKSFLYFSKDVKTRVIQEAIEEHENSPYKYISDNLVIDRLEKAKENTKQYADKILPLFASGMSYKKIADTLNEQQISGPANKPWLPKAVKWIEVSSRPVNFYTPDSITSNEEVRNIAIKAKKQKAREFIEQVGDTVLDLRNTGLSYRKVADALNEQQIPSPKCGAWLQTTSCRVD